ncbi:unnamed protein product [Microthlaspi erraticum]|uniref:GRF-type domain-containing protein n=1 Tax=Microthlaspi erraticum TaxID=1685480 RepID=A0A6D2JPP5_9BRAS|nr:unnamed protein product [Microthlaspi erraticum]
MSNQSGAYSGTSGGRARGRIVGVPKKCWCGELVVEKISKSDPNPYRRYYRCGFAATERLVNDNHAFKWIDEALVNEVETLRSRLDRLEEDVREITADKIMLENMVIEKIQTKMEREVFERVEETLAATKSDVKKMMLVVIVGCMVIVGCSKLVG